MRNLNFSYVVDLNGVELFVIFTIWSSLQTPNYQTLVKNIASDALDL